MPIHRDPHQSAGYVWSPANACLKEVATHRMTDSVEKSEYGSSIRFDKSGLV
jgi:hypothetical protein